MAVVEHEVVLYRDLRSRTEEIADERLKEHVLNGLELLKERYGEDWVEHVNPETLSMSSGMSCVLGQVGRKMHGNVGYGDELELLGLNGEREAEEHGFYACDGLYGNLDRAWRFVLTGRWFDGETV